MNYAQAFTDHTGDSTELVADRFEDSAILAQSLINSDLIPYSEMDEDWISDLSEMPVSEKANLTETIKGRLA